MRSLLKRASFQLKLFFDAFDNPGSEFFCRVSGQEASLAVQFNFRVVSSFLESRSVPLEPSDKLTLLHGAPTALPRIQCNHNRLRRQSICDLF